MQLASLLAACIALTILLHCAPAVKGAATSCAAEVADFERKHGNHVTPTDPSDAFVFFLHVPRTAGKTYANCFLRASVPPTKRCSPSYDFLRYEQSQVGCRYLVSHDDYSLTEKLPKNTLVITQLRNPVSRVLSAYEFAIEVASRRVHEADKEVFETALNSTSVNTYNVWPWSKLVPWFRKDIQQRLEALEQQARAENATRPAVWERHWDEDERRYYYWAPTRNVSVWDRTPVNATLNPYDNPLVMPLKEWLETDIAKELVHEGSTLQILGLTNYSHWPEATELRRCFFEDEDAREKLTKIAMERLAATSHVGLTEQLDDSVASLAAGLGYKLGTTAWKPIPKGSFAYDDPEFEPENVRVTFNSTREDPSGRVVDLTVAEARMLIHKLDRQAQGIKAKLQKMEPQLQELVDKEEAWFLEQENGGGSVGVVGKVVGWFKSALGFRGKGAPWLGANAAAASGASADLDDDDDDDAQQQQQQQMRQQQHIESPWSDQIEALDANVYALQQQYDGLRRDIEALRDIDEVRGPEVPQGPARLIPPEEDFRDTTTLGQSYRRCSNNATSRAANKRNSAFKHVRTPWDESFAFTTPARKALDPSITARILELNPVDQLLWDEGKKLLEAAMSEQKVSGIFEHLPSADAPAKRRRRTGKPTPEAGQGKNSAATKKVKDPPPAGAVTASTDSHEEL